MKNLIAVIAIIVSNVVLGQIANNETASGNDPETILGLSVNDFKSAIVYPDPVTGSFEISNTDLESLSLYNSNGELVSIVYRNENNQFKIEEELPGGKYFAKHEDDPSKIVSKLVVRNLKESGRVLEYNLSESYTDNTDRMNK